MADRGAPSGVGEAAGEVYAPGKNAVEIKPLGGRGGYYRTYEIYGRRRLKDSQHLVNPRWFLRREYLLDPYQMLATMRENYERYRDWVSNCDWVSRYDDVTSIFQDEANFETRSKRWFYGMEDDPSLGRDLAEELPVLWAWARKVEACMPVVAAELIDGFARAGSADLVREFTSKLHVYVLAHALGLPREDFDRFAGWYAAMADGWHWHPGREMAGKDAMAAFAAYVQPLLDQRRREPGDDMISAIAALDLEGGPTTAADVVATVLEGDAQTLTGGLANTWFQLLTHPEALAEATGNHALTKRAWQETLRHSTPVISAKRFARHEVERLGGLFPEGGLVILSAAAANRDPRIFEDPDEWDIHRLDLCFREPRGHYRADGLPAAVTFGTGRPSRHPAVPEDRPRSRLAIIQEQAVTASELLMARLPHLRLAPGAEPAMYCRWPWDMHTCWQLPVIFRAGGG